MRPEPPGYVAIWDPGGERRRHWVAWATRQDGRMLFDHPPAAAIGFGEPSGLLNHWSDSNAAGVVLGELYQPGPEDTPSPDASSRQSPTERLVTTCARDDLAGLPEIDGLFCAAVWDRHRQRLVLYRDPSCARSLYWLRHDDWAVVATRLDLLVALPGVTKGVGRRGLLEYLRFLDVSPPNTIYAGVRALEPGAPALLDAGGVEYPLGTENDLIHPPAATGTPRKPGHDAHAETTFEAAVDALDEALTQGVAERLEGDGLTGISLSGGIDSSLLCAIGARIDRERVAAFTLGFADAPFDESPIASAVARHLGIKHRLALYSVEDYAAQFQRFLSLIDLPFADPAGLPTLLFFEECRRHTDVLLDGTGADTLIGIMPARHTRVATQYAARLPRPVRQAVGRVLSRLPIAAEYAAIWDFDSPEDLLIRWKGWTRKEIEALMGTSVSLDHTRFYRLYRAFARDAHFERYSALMGNLPDDRVHQAAELTGLRVRFPYWDRRVEAVVRQLPQPYRFTEQQPKRLLRALLERYAPTTIWDQPKHGFDFPFVAFLKHNDYELVRRYLSPTLLHGFDVLSPEMVSEYVKAFVAGNDDMAFRIWALVVLFGWLEHHYTVR